MDTHYGKYQGPLAAVTERWVLDGDAGDEEYSDSDIGCGTVLWRGLHTLSWEDGRMLQSDYDCDFTEVDALAHEMGRAQGIVHEWDEQGFIYAWTLDTMHELHEAEARIAEMNASYVDEDELDQTIARHPAGGVDETGGASTCGCGHLRHEGRCPGWHNCGCEGEV